MLQEQVESRKKKAKELPRKPNHKDHVVEKQYESEDSSVADDEDDEYDYYPNQYVVRNGGHQSSSG